MTSLADNHHRFAMDLCDRADALRKAGSEERARAEYRLACEQEELAAGLVDTQPWHAILRRSAAWLAIFAGDPEWAERLACSGLARKDVPPKYRKELREVLAEAQRQIQAAEAAKGEEQ
jgi:hypothetical protein